MTKKDFIIGVDMDDTIENLCDAWVKWLNEKYHCSVSPDDITEWELYKYYPSLTQEQVYEPLYDNSFWLTVHPKEDAMQYLKMLFDEGYSIFICSNTHYKTAPVKMEEVLFKYFPYIGWRNLIFLRYKQMLHLDVLVDDYHKNLVNADYIGLLYDTPHNRDFKEDGYSIMRVYDWEQVYRAINSLYELKKNYGTLNMQPK